MRRPDRAIVGWDIGGAHVKACVMEQGEVTDAAQWPAPLWLGLDQLEGVIADAGRRWPGLGAARHAVTMSGEMVDLFTDRADGVARIAGTLSKCLGPAEPPALHFFAGKQGWCAPDELSRHWQGVASANWLASARHAASRFDEGLLVDIGSTTTDLIAFRGGRVLGTSRTDADRLESGELVYQGVVRTPLCALARRIEWAGRRLNVMNELFATTADVYRLTGELDPAHDQGPSADRAPKDIASSARRLGRMIGLDLQDGTTSQWLAFATRWRERQVAEIGGELHRVAVAHRLSSRAVVVSAGCGDFLVPDVVAHALAMNAPGTPRSAQAWPVRAYGEAVASVSRHPRPPRRAAGEDADACDPAGATVARWAQVCAPCVAVAALLDEALR